MINRSWLAGRSNCPVLVQLCERQSERKVRGRGEGVRERRMLVEGRGGYIGPGKEVDKPSSVRVEETPLMASFDFHMR